MTGKATYTYKLEDWEREELECTINAKVCSKEKRTRAYILLKCDSGLPGGAWSEKALKTAYDVSARKVERTRKRMVEEGLHCALNGKERAEASRSRKLDGDQEAQLLALACSKAPDGRVRWTLELLANKLVQLKVVDSISKECIRQTLKKMNLSLG